LYNEIIHFFVPLQPKVIINPKNNNKRTITIMRRSLLNKPNLSKSLRQALVLFTLLLLPSVAWGQVTVTKTITFNKGEGTTTTITEDYYEGAIPVSVNETVGSSDSYDYDSNVTILNSGALTKYLYSSSNVQFTIDEYMRSDTQWFIIRIPGNYPKKPTSVKLFISYTTATEADDDDDTYSAIIEVGDDSAEKYTDTSTGKDYLVNGLSFYGDPESGQPGTIRSEDGDLDIYIYLDGDDEISPTFTIKKIEMAYETEFYDLSVAGIPVTDVNMADVLGDGKVSFTSNNTLTLNNANFSVNGNNAIESGLNNLMVNLVGNNAIYYYGTSYCFKGTMSGATVTFTTDDTPPGSLVGQGNDTNMFDGIEPDYQNGLKYTINGDSYDIMISDYGIKIGSNNITSANVDSDGKITGIDGIKSGTVKFTPADGTTTPATLTLNNAEITNIESSLEGDLKIEISGENQLNTISSTNANAGKLHITTTDNPSNPTFLSLIAPNDETSVINGFTDFTTTLTAYSVNNGSPESPITVTYDTNVLKTGNAIANAVAFLLSYDLTVAGVAVTSLNAGNILDGVNDGKVSFSPATLQDQTTIPATLMLTGATIDGGILWNSGADLSIELSGKNSIIASGDVFKANVDMPCSLHIKKINDATSATLKYSGTIDKFTLSPTGDFKTQFEINDNSITYNYLTTEDVYNLEVAGIQVHNIEGELGYKGNILQNSGTPTVTFDGTNTLTLNNAELTNTIHWGANADLTVNILGSNSITITESTPCISSEYGKAISFTRGDTNNPCSLTLSSEVGTNVFNGFSNASSPTVTGTGLYWLPTEDLSSATITSSLLGGGSGTDEYPFLINNLNDLKNFAKYVNEGILTSEFVRLTDNIDCSEWDNFEPIGQPFIGTFTGGEENNRHTISNLKITISDGNSTGYSAGLFGKIDGGTVKNITLDGCIINGGTHVGGIVGDISSNATIDNCVVSNLTITSSNTAYNPKVGGIAGDNTGATISNCQVVLSPSSITASTNNDDSGAASYAGGIVGYTTGGTFTNNSVTSNAGTSQQTTPSIKATHSAGGYPYAGTIIGYYNDGNTATFTNNTYASNVYVQAGNDSDSSNDPRGIGQENGSGYDIPNQVMMAGTKKVTISATGLNDYGTRSLSEDLGSSYCLAERSGTPEQLTALYVLPEATISLVVSSENGYKPTFTLSNSDVVVTTEEKFANDSWTINFDFEMPEDDVTATIAFARDLASQLYTLSTDQESYTYTGEGIEPSISLTISTDPDNPVALTKGTDYEIKDYFEVKEGVATPMYEDDGTTPKAPVNVGSYKISITGKGDYSGTRELEFSITKRAVNWSEDKWTSPEAKTDLKYTGADMELVTAATVPEGVTIKYYTKYSSEQFSDYDYSESQDEEWSEEVPTGKEIGYYAVFYKVEGGDNYQDWGPCEVGIAVNIDKDEVTITAENQEVTYNATAQEYDISKVVVDNENAKVVVTYYATAEDLEGGTALTGAPTDAGIYYVRVTLNEESQQHYVAEPANATFTINQLSLEGAEITLNYTELTYNGNEQTVSVTEVKVNGIVVDSDNYLVDGNKGTEAREYTVTVTAKPDNDNFKNNFVGSAEKVWKIKRTASAEELGFESETQTFSTYYNPNESFNLPEGYVAYIITGVNGTEVLTTRISYIPKGVAVLVEKGTSSDEATEDITNTDLLPLKGTVEPLDVISITGGTVYVLYNGEFVKSTSGMIPAKRCYLLIESTVAAGTRAFGINHHMGANGIDSAFVYDNDEKAGDKWYDLQGRRIKKPTKAGLYIVNGKKVVVNIK
jgi:hypothetical protein